MITKWKNNRKAISIILAFTLIMSMLLSTGFVFAEDEPERPDVVETDEVFESVGSGGVLDDAGVRTDAVSGNLTHFSTWKVKGGYVAAGTGMRNTGKGKISIKGIPAGSSIKAAYLYWTIISETNTNANKKGKFDGTKITGSLIGSSASPCWANGSTRTYWANVSSLVSATDKTYILKGFASGRTDSQDPWSGTPTTTAPLLNGASLVIIYKNGRYPKTHIFVYDGSVTSSSTHGDAVTNITGIPSYKSYLAYTSYIVSDGQSNGVANGYFNGNLMSAADFEGTDRRYYSGDYSFGNLWDTENNSSNDTAKRSISVGKKMSAYSTSAAIKVEGMDDCVVHAAQILSVSKGHNDTDGDGLRDTWEANGLSGLNLAKKGANPFHKDIFMEIDYMATAGGENPHMPNATVVNRIVDSFANGDVVNPDRKKGIAMHIDVSNSIPHAVEFTTTPGCGDLFSKLETTKTANMDANRYKAYHYQLWVHDLCVEYGSTSGIAQGIPGDDSFVSLGSWSGQGSEDARVGTSIHELGHTLNLRHGYPTGASADGDGGANDPYTPNHLSIMSYLYQIDGVIKNGSYGKYDFQRWDLPSLDESCLNENNGVGSLSALDKYGLRWYTGTSTLRQNLTAGSANGPNDWDASGGIGTCVNESINKDTDIETLNATKKEWTRIIYNGGAIGFGIEFGLDADGNKIPVEEIVPLEREELTFEMWQEMMN